MPENQKNAKLINVCGYKWKMQGLNSGLIKAIFNKASDKTICGRQDTDYELNKRAEQQIKEFNRQGYSVAVLRDEMKYVYLTDEHTMDDVKKDIDNRSKLLGV